MVNVHVVVLCDHTQKLSWAVQSFIWQRHANKTLHIVNTGDQPLTVSPDTESCPHDIRIHGGKSFTWLERLDGLTVFFHPDALYMPWYITKMVTSWIDCGYKCYSVSRVLSRSEETPAIYFSETKQLFYTTIFQSCHVQEHAGRLDSLLDTMTVENTIGAGPHYQCPAILWPVSHGEQPGEIGVQFVNYDMLRLEVEAYLNNHVRLIFDLQPKGEDGKPLPSYINRLHDNEIEEIKRWVPRPLEIVCVISDDQYHTWQALVLCYNLRKWGYSKYLRLIVYHQFSHPLPAFINAMEAFPEVQVYYYKDERADMAAYKSVMRPHVLKRHWQQCPYLQHCAVLYIDSDIIFVDDPDLYSLTIGPACWTGNTRDYIGATSYIMSSGMGPHGREVLEQMAGVVGIDPELLIQKDGQSGGAQYMLKDVTAEFWAKVEKDCVILHLCMLRLNSDLLNPSTPDSLKAIGQLTHIQAWCADMWAVLWNLWLIGKDTPICGNLSFTWGTDQIDLLHSHPIHHNAGVTHSDYSKFRMFAKWQYVNGWPVDVNLRDFSESYCTFEYAREVVECFDWLKSENYL